MTLLLRSLAAVSAESRHEAQQIFITRIAAAVRRIAPTRHENGQITGDEQWL
jgi:hypothetical protein